MTVNELIEHLQTIRPDHRHMEIRVWLPGSQIAIDGIPLVRLPTPLNAERVIVIEGNVIEGSALK